MGSSQGKGREKKLKKVGASPISPPQVCVVPPEDGTTQNNEARSVGTSRKPDAGGSASIRHRDAPRESQHIEDPSASQKMSGSSARSSSSKSRTSTISSVGSEDAVKKKPESATAALPSPAEVPKETTDRLSPSAADGRQSMRLSRGSKNKVRRSKRATAISGANPARQKDANEDNDGDADSPGQKDAREDINSGADSPGQRDASDDGGADSPGQKDASEDINSGVDSPKEKGASEDNGDGVDSPKEKDASEDNDGGADSPRQKDGNEDNDDDMGPPRRSRKKQKRKDASGDDDGGADPPRRNRKKNKRKEADENSEVDEERKKKKKKRRHKSSRTDDGDNAVIESTKKKKKKRESKGSPPPSPSKKPSSRKEDANREAPREDPTLTAPAEWRTPAAPSGDARSFLTFGDGARDGKHPFALIAKSHKFTPSDFLARLQVKNNTIHYVNIRWQRPVLHAIYNFQAAIAENKIPTSTWLDTPLKDLQAFYPLINAEGKKESRTLGALFAIMVRVMTSNKDAKLEILDQQSLTWFQCLTGRKLQGRAARLQIMQSWAVAQGTFIGKEDRRALNARSFSDVMDIIFAACQGIHAIRLGKCGGGTDATIAHYGQAEPLMPQITFLDMELSSATQFAADCKVQVTFGGSARSIGPWGMRIECETLPNAVELTSTQIKAGRDNVLNMGWETWSKLPLEKFAETLGDRSGMHYVYRTPLQIFAEKGYVLTIKNVTEDKKWVIPAESVKDLDRWLFENTKDMGNGWGNLCYLGKGEMKDGKLVNTVMWDEKACKFAIEQIPRQRKAATAAD